MQKNIAVIYGGVSVEHEISVITGVLALNSLSGAGCNVMPVYITPEGRWVTDAKLSDIEYYKTGAFGSLKQVALIPGENTFYALKGGKLKPYFLPDCVLNCCHGAAGENGSLSGLLELCNIPSASPGVLGSAAAMDKSVCKLIAKALNIKTVPALKISKTDYAKRGRIALKYISEKIGFPVIVKPVSLGSSIGVSAVQDSGSLNKALELAFLYDETVLAERLITPKKEINCAAYLYKDEVIVSECDQPELKAEFLSFDDKYLSAPKQRGAPDADIDAKTAQKIKSVTVQLYKRLNLNGVVRADFLFDGKDVYFNELNTVPGSLAYYLFLDSADKMPAFLNALIEEGITRHKRKERLAKVFSGGVIGKIDKSGYKHLKKR